MRLGKVTKDQNAKLQESVINDPPASKEQETLKSFQFARTNLLRTRTDHFFAEFVEHLKFQIKCRPLHSTFPITDTRQFAILNTSLDLSSTSYICSILFAIFFYIFFTSLNTSLDLSSISYASSEPFTPIAPGISE